MTLNRIKKMLLAFLLTFSMQHSILANALPDMPNPLYYPSTENKPAMPSNSDPRLLALIGIFTLCMIDMHFDFKQILKKMDEENSQLKSRIERMFHSIKTGFTSLGMVYVMLSSTIALLASKHIVAYFDLFAEYIKNDITK